MVFHQHNSAKKRKKSVFVHESLISKDADNFSNLSVVNAHFFCSTLFTHKLSRSSGFTGKDCETNLNFCTSEPCLNGGECSDSKHGFICKCTAPFFGIRCEKKTDMCQHTVCQHSVGCKDLGTDVKCSCLPGYGGKYCDKSKCKLALVDIYPHVVN